MSSPTMAQYEREMEGAWDLNRQLKRRNAELEKIILSITNNSKEVLTNSKNTIAVRKGFQMSGSVKHYIVSRADFNSLKEQVK